MKLIYVAIGIYIVLGVLGYASIGSVGAQLDGRGKPSLLRKVLFILLGPLPQSVQFKDDETEHPRLHPELSQAVASFPGLKTLLIAEVYSPDRICGPQGVLALLGLTLLLDDDEVPGPESHFLAGRDDSPREQIYSPAIRINQGSG